MQMPVDEAEVWDRDTQVYKRGKRILEDWHHECRIRRIEAKMNAERKALGLPPLKKIYKTYEPAD